MKVPIRTCDVGQRLRRISVLAMMSLILASQAFADQRCADNAIDGGSMQSDNPADVAMCQVTARIYCEMANDRNAKLPSAIAVRNASEWLSHYHRVGSHVTPDYKPLLQPAAEYVYAHPELDAWAIYYHAGYRCVAARDKTVNFEQFSRLQDACEQEHPNDYDGDADSVIAKCYRDSLHLRTGKIVVGPVASQPMP